MAKWRYKELGLLALDLKQLDEGSQNPKWDVVSQRGRWVLYKVSILKSNSFSG